ncbi:tetratricopeptide repeat protein [bacterium]|nr:MAG: tetratricopeptide repeat protein [bacterium]
MLKYTQKLAMRCVYTLALISILLSDSIAQSRIAVLPFKNISGDKQYDWLADGFCETLTSSFAQIGSFVVVERSQIEKVLKEQDFQMSDYANEAKVVEVGKILGVDKMLIGSYQVFAGNINVNTRIVNMQTGQVDKAGALANKRAKLENIFDLQDEICVSQAKAFGGEITQKEVQKIASVTSSNKTNSFSAYELYNKGVNEYYAKNYADAIVSFNKAIEANPQYSEAYNYLGLVADNQGDNNQAIYYYKKAFEIKPTDAVVANNLGIVYAVKKEYDNARWYTNKSIELNPNYYNAYNNLGWISETLGDKTTALEHFLKAYELDPTNDYACRHIGGIYEGQGKYEEAVKYYQKSIDNNPNDAGTYYDMGVAYWSLEDWNAVVDAWEKCLSINKSHKEALEWLPKAKEKLGSSSSKRVLDNYSLGLEYYNDKEYDKALAAFKTEIENNRRNSSAWGYLGLCHYYKENYQESIRCYNKSIAISPTDWVYYDLGVTYWSLADWDAVIDAWGECLAINPDYAEAKEWLPKAKEKKAAKSGSSFNYYDEGVSLYNKKEYTAAIQSLKQELAVNKKNSNAWGYLGLCYDSQDNASDALYAYNKSIMIKPTDWVYYNMGVVYWKQKNWPAVVDAWEECLVLNPNYKEALEWLPKAKENMNK